MESKPTGDTLKNRKAGDALMRQAAMRGDGIAGAYFELESLARKTTEGSFIVDTEILLSDEDWDDVRPY